MMSLWISVSYEFYLSLYHQYVQQLLYHSIAR